MAPRFSAMEDETKEARKTMRNPVRIGWPGEVKDVPQRKVERVSSAEIARFIDGGEGLWTEDKNLGRRLYAQQFLTNYVGSKWVAVDNTSGEAFTEEFPSAKKAVRWLTHRSSVAGTSLDRRRRR